MNNDIKKVIVSESELKAICKKLGEQISKDYQDKCPILIGLLKGCEPFFSDLIKNISIYCKLDFMKVSSYFGTTESSGTVNIKSDIQFDVKDQDVIIVDDIIDTGRTSSLIKNLFEQRGARSVELCCLLDKHEARLVDVDVKYVGGYIPNEFVVGYGLDYNELYRNLPYIGVLKEEIYR